MSVNLIRKSLTRAPTARAEALAPMTAYCAVCWGYNVLNLVIDTAMRRGLLLRHGANLRFACTEDTEGILNFLIFMLFHTEF